MSTDTQRGASGDRIITEEVSTKAGILLYSNTEKGSFVKLVHPKSVGWIRLDGASYSSVTALTKEDSPWYYFTQYWDGTVHIVEEPVKLIR